jgi:HTH DNA binding domain
VADNPLVSAERAQAWLGPLSLDGGGFDERRFTQWRDTYVPDGRRPSERPALLRVADAAAAWMDGGICDIPDATQGLAVAALLLRRTGTLSIIPLPLWAGWSGLCAPDEPGTLPRLRGDVSARLAPGGAPWAVVFLHLAAEAARSGSRILADLRAAESAGLAFAAREDKRSRLPATVEMLLRQPALTAPALARRLEITPQAALRLFSRLEREGLVGEVTGRGSFRAFATVCS